MLQEFTLQLKQQCEFLVLISITLIYCNRNAQIPQGAHLPGMTTHTALSLITPRLGDAQQPGASPRASPTQALTVLPMPVQLCHRVPRRQEPCTGPWITCLLSLPP